MDNSKLKVLAEKRRISFKSIDSSPRNVTTVFKRSGMSYSKRSEALVVKNNAINANIVKINHHISSRHLSQSRNDNSKNKVLKTRSNMKSNSEKNLHNKELLNHETNESKYKGSHNMQIDSLHELRRIRKILHPLIPEDSPLTLYPAVILYLMYS